MFIIKDNQTSFFPSLKTDMIRFLVKLENLLSLLRANSITKSRKKYLAKPP